MLEKEKIKLKCQELATLIVHNKMINERANERKLQISDRIIQIKIATDNLYKNVMEK